MYILGEDDLSTSSIENANLVDVLFYCFYFPALQIIDVGKHVLSSLGPFLFKEFWYIVGIY